MRRFCFTLLYLGLLALGALIRICWWPIDKVIALNFFLADIPLSIGYQVGLLLSGWGEQYMLGYHMKFRRRPWRLGPFYVYPWHFLAWAFILWMAFAPLPLRPFTWFFHASWFWMKWVLVCVAAGLTCGFLDAIWQQALKKPTKVWMEEFHKFFQQRIAA